MTQEIPDFGQAGSDYIPQEYDADDIWILKFQKGETQVRIAPAEMVNEVGETVYGVSAWPTEREHFDIDIPGNGSYPCAERFGIECIGCKHPDKKVRGRTRYWYVNVLDKDGRPRVYKMGQKLHEPFVDRQQRALAADPKDTQSVSKRDFLIVRTGSTMNDTSYYAEPMDAYPIDFSEHEFADIKKLLRERYAKAVEFYTSGAPAAQKVAEDESVPVRHGHIGQPAPAEESGEVAKPWTDGKTPTVEELEELDSGELKEYLDTIPVDYPVRAPRSRLLALAKKSLEPPF